MTPLPLVEMCSCPFLRLSFNGHRVGSMFQVQITNFQLYGKGTTGTVLTILQKKSWTFKFIVWHITLQRLNSNGTNDLCVWNKLMNSCLLVEFVVSGICKMYLLHQNDAWFTTFSQITFLYFTHLLNNLQNMGGGH